MLKPDYVHNLFYLVIKFSQVCNFEKKAFIILFIDVTKRDKRYFKKQNVKL